MIMNSDINKLESILFVHLSAISLENFKNLALIIPEILELIKLHTYKFGLVYMGMLRSNSQVSIESNVVTSLEPCHAKSCCFHMQKK